MTGLTIISDPRLCKAGSHMCFQLIHKDMFAAQRTLHSCVNWEGGGGVRGGAQGEQKSGGTLGGSRRGVNEKTDGLIPGMGNRGHNE